MAARLMQVAGGGADIFAYPLAHSNTGTLANQTAGTGGILCDEETYHAAMGSITFEEREPVKLKAHPLSLHSPSLLVGSP